MTASTAIEFLDLRGLKCPLPVLRTRKYLRGKTQGSQVQVLTSDPLAVIDIPHMCNEDGHGVTNPEKTAIGHSFLITVGA